MQLVATHRPYETEVQVVHEVVLHNMNYTFRVKKNLECIAHVHQMYSHAYTRSALLVNKKFCDICIHM